MFYILTSSREKHGDKLAFTLAEVLITLLIIGVVSSLVIPTLINDTQNAELKTAWKKSYAEISNAINLVKLDNGGTLRALCGTYDLYQHECLTSALKTKLSYTKYCGDHASYGSCWHGRDGLYSDGSFKLLNGADLQLNSINGYFGSGSAGLILNNGVLMLISYSTPACDSSTNLAFYENLSNGCGHITVDVNGFKGPNTVGKDIFSLYVLENRTLPVGTATLKSTCTTTGQGCSAQYLYQ